MAMGKNGGAETEDRRSPDTVFKALRRLSKIAPKVGISAEKLLRTRLENGLVGSDAGGDSSFQEKAWALYSKKTP